MSALSGRPAAELEGRSIWDCFPTARRRLEPYFNRALETGEPQVLKYLFRRQGIWRDVRIHPTADGLAVFLRDITEQVNLERVSRKRARALAEQGKILERANEDLRALLLGRQRLLDASCDFICTIDCEGRFVEVGRGVEAILGFAPADLVGRRYMELVHLEDLEKTAQAESAMFGGTRRVTVRNRYVARDGQAVPLEWTATWIEDEGVCYANARDIRGVIEAETRLSRTQRLEAIGKLTGGIAHDFNNILTAVLGNAEEIMSRSEREDLRELAETIRDAAERGADLTNQLLTFARQQPLTPEVVNITRLLSAAPALLSRLLGGKVAVTVRTPDDLPLVRVDRGQLEAAILNLCINAVEAQPTGGSITITVRATRFQRDGEGEQDGVEIFVADKGYGMTPEAALRAFEPFFTTKDSSRHSGMGLSMVYGFAIQSGGDVGIETSTAAGTTVRLVLPSVHDLAPATGPRSSEPPTKARVLVVEDEALVRDHVCRQLTHLGYDVHSAGDGPSALRALEQIGDLDLLLTDIVMPGGLNGWELATEVRSRKPHMKILFTSGYSHEALGSEKGASDIPLLRKPYRRQVLADMVRKMLE